VVSRGPRDYIPALLEGAPRADIGHMTHDADRLARLYEIAAFERPLTDVERLEAGLAAHLDHDHVIHLWERAAFERPLGEHELHEVAIDLGTAA
jgi:hypothetical protein